jgi:hypothetical protein
MGVLLSRFSDSTAPEGAQIQGNTFYNPNMNYSQPLVLDGYNDALISGNRFECHQGGFLDFCILPAINVKGVVSCTSCNVRTVIEDNVFDHFYDSGPGSEPCAVDLNGNSQALVVDNLFMIYPSGNGASTGICEPGANSNLNASTNLVITTP